jgi:hypothetical protein
LLLYISNVIAHTNLGALYEKLNIYYEYKKIIFMDWLYLAPISYVHQTMAICFPFVIISLIKIHQLLRDQNLKFPIVFLSHDVWSFTWMGGLEISKYPNFSMLFK